MSEQKKQKPTAPEVGELAVKEPRARAIWKNFTASLRVARKDYGYIWLGALIPAVLFYLIYLVRGLYPFGDGTVLVLDLNGQYAYFFENLRSCVLEGNTLLYSWSRALGGEFLGMYAYYLASPLSYLICLFPKGYTQEFLLVMFMIKSALCGGTMAFYLHKHSVSKNKLAVIAFSVLYAMSAYCVIQQNNTMWIDAVMWLPLVIYGVEELIKNGKYKMYVIFLALTLASNFYIGYMVCIFVFLYFFFYLIAHGNENAGNPHGEKYHALRALVRIGFFSILAVGIAALLVLSAYYSLQFGKNTFDTPSWEIELKFDFIDFIFKLFPSSYDTVRIDGLPFVYCGLLTLILSPLYFCSKKIGAREKIASGVLLMILIFSMMISTFDLIWHGFQEPNWLNFRYSFIFCFFLVFLAFRAFDHFEEIHARSVGCVAAFIIFILIYIQATADSFEEKLQNLTYGNTDFMVHPFAMVVLSLVLLVAYLCIIAAMKSAKNKDLVASVLLVTVCIEAFLSGLCNINDFDSDVGYTEYQKYVEFNELFYPVVDTLQEVHDSSFYRFEKTYHRKYNDNMALDIRGLSNSTSTLNKETVNFLRMLGYYSQSHKSQYLGGTPVTDSLLGIKYIISDRDLSVLYGQPVLSGADYAAYLGVTEEELCEMTFADEYKDYSSADLKVYYNKNALSLAFAVDDDIFDVNMADHNNNVDEDDEKYNPDGYTSPFTRVNALVTAILGEDETVELFKPATQNGDPYLDGATVTTSSKHYKYKGDSGQITYSYTVPQGTMLYAFFPAYYNREIKLSSDTAKIFDGTTKLAKCNDRIVELGYVLGNQYSLTVTINNTRDEFYTKMDDSFIYYVDKELLNTVMSEIKENEMIIDADYKEDDIPGTITTANDDQLILTTIPYDEGWDVYVDGKKVEITKALDSLISFRIDDAGEHSIRFKYRSTPFKLGGCISIVSISVFALIIIFEKKLKRVGIVNRFFFPAENATVDSAETDKKKKK